MRKAIPAWRHVVLYLCIFATFMAVYGLFRLIGPIPLPSWVRVIVIFG